MRKILVAAATLAALALAGCGSLSVTGTCNAAGQLTAAKAEATAETAYTASADAYIDAESILPLTVKAVLKADLGEAHDALLAARSAEAICDTTTLQAKITAVTQLAQQVQAIAQPTATPAS